MIPREFAYGLLILASPTMLRAADHWSFLPLRQPDIPVVADSTWAQSPIDYFVLARLTRAGLQPSPSADRRTLIRRLYLDLLGIPPAPHHVAAFLADEHPDAGVESEIFVTAPGSEIDEGHELVGAIDASHSEVFGAPAERDTVRWFSDASALTRYGIESVNYGTSSGLPEADGENLEIKGLLDISKVYALVAARVCEASA